MKEHLHTDFGITDQEAYEMSVARKQVRDDHKVQPPAQTPRMEYQSFSESILQHSGDLILIYDSAGSVLNASANACAYLGYTLKEICRKSIDDILELKPEVRQNLLGYFSSDKLDKETNFISASSLHIPVEVIASAILYEGRKAGMIIARDLTEKCNNEEIIHKLTLSIHQLESRLAILQQDENQGEQMEGVRLKTSFLANMSHEIRTPMNAIIGFANLLNDPGISGEQIREYTAVIRSSGGNLLRIIDNILELSRIEGNELEINLVTTNLPQLLLEIKDMHIELINSMEKNIHLSLSLPDMDNQTQYRMDHIRIKQVFSNLLHNAIKFTEQGSVQFGYRILPDKQVEFFVHDTGIGIPAEEIGSVFDRFWHGENNLNSKYGGTGLGLTITRSLVEKMGGTIWVDSKPGQGSEFRFVLNRLDKAADSLEMPAWEGNLSGKSDQLNLLIVEDEEVNFILFREMLSNMDWSLVWARNGEEAITMVENDAFDMVLMDIKMPGLDGFAATRRIKELRPGLPVIAQTAYAMENDRIRCLESGCDNYIAKPIVKETLLGMISHYTGKRSRQEY